MPRYWADQTGSFAIAQSNSSSSGMGQHLVLQQQVFESPSLGGTGWHNGDSEAAISIIGDVQEDVGLVRHRYSAALAQLFPQTQILDEPICDKAGGFIVAPHRIGLI